MGKKRRHPDQYIDDWLENQTHTARSRGKRGVPPKKNPEKSHELDPALTNATVTEVFPKCCHVKVDEDGKIRLANYRRATVLGRQEGGPRERSPVAVGDRVKATAIGGNDAIVDGVARRRNQLARPAPGREEGMIHVLAANVDLLLIVASLREPEFSAGLVDRFLIAAQAAGIPALLCVNKMDLQAAPESDPPWKVYADLGTEVFPVSASAGEGIEALRSRLIGVKTVFCGHSGVGKTSTLRALLGREIGKVGEVSDVTGKGRHTTTGAVMIEGPEGSEWIDTPGVRSFGLVGIEPEELRDYFPEFADRGCTARGCLHEDEEDCEARDLPRHPSYLRILESLRLGEG